MCDKLKEETKIRLHIKLVTITNLTYYVVTYGHKRQSWKQSDKLKLGSE